MLAREWRRGRRGERAKEEVGWKTGFLFDLLTFRDVHRVL